MATTNPETFGEMEARIAARIAADARPHELDGIARALAVVIEAARDAQGRFEDIGLRIEAARRRANAEADEPGPSDLRGEYTAAFAEVTALREAVKTIDRLQGLKRREGAAR